MTGQRPNPRLEVKPFISEHTVPMLMWLNILYIYISNRLINVLKLVKLIIKMAGMAFFTWLTSGYLIEERRRWPVITASPRGQCSK